MLPKERTKNKRQHFVPLSAPAAEVIEAQPARGERDLIFGRDDGAFSGWSNCKERLDKRIKEANGKAIAPWKLHDLRRSFATYAGGGLPKDQIAKLPARDKELAGGLGTQPHVIEAVLNHISGSKAGVAGVYNRSDYGHEKRIALDKWAERLIAIVEDRPSKITPLRREA